jgi:hypothetical protein
MLGGCVQLSRAGDRASGAATPPRARPRKMQLPEGS